jgi:uncharacterized protein
LARIKISAKEVVLDIRSGLSNGEIGQKYGLSENGIRRLFDKLLSVNLLTNEEHHQRIAPLPDSIDLLGDDGGNRAGSEQAITRHSETPLTSAQPLGTFEDDDRRPDAGLTRGDEAADPSAQPCPDTQEGQQQIRSAPAEFIDISNQGRNRWWRYVVSILFILIFPTVMSVISVAVLAPNSTVDKATGSFIGIDSFYNYILVNLWFVFLFAAIFLVVRFEHKRPFVSLINRNQSVDWKKIGKSFGIFSALLFCGLVVDYFVAPETLQYRLDLGRFLWFAPTVLVLTPIQTTAEELFCRGYLLQMMALLTRNRVALVLVSGVLFMLPHLANPELASGFLTMVLYYFAVGGFLTVVTLKSNGLEVAMGVHAATNLFAALVVNYENSALQTEPIFFCTVFDPLGSLVSFCIMAVVFYLLMFGGRLTFRKPWIVWRRNQ